MSSQGTATLLIAAMIAGAVVPFQAGANAALGRALGHPLWATVISLIVSIICVLPVMLAMKVSLPSFASLATQPKWIWIGGIAGVLYITAAILFAPKLGAAGFMTAVIAGQLIASVLIDYFGLMGFASRAITPERLIGVAFVASGVLIMQAPVLWRTTHSLTTGQ
jgi:transporter family-2 protein